MSPVGVTISGLQHAQYANLALIAACEAGGALGRAVRYAALEAQRYAAAITHVDTGTLKASHHIASKNGGLRAVVYVDPSARNPRTGERPSIYGEYEEFRGGSHAFYRRTVDERGYAIARAAADGFMRQLP